MLELNKIYNMDCLDGMKQIDDNSIDCIIIDPPYGINKEGVLNDDSLDAYYKVLPELYRVLKNNSWFITFCSIGKIPEMFINNPFSYVWSGSIYYPNKEKPKNCRIGLSKQSLYLVFEKGRAKRNRIIRDIQEHVYNGRFEVTKHPAPKPTKCIEKLIQCFSKEGDVVLDCFMGSGTTALACKKLYRDFIGFELSKSYYNFSLKRLLNIPIRLEEFQT